MGRIEEHQGTNRVSLSCALFVHPTEDLVELSKLTEDKRYLVCQ